MNGLYIKFAGELNPEKRTLHEVLANEPAFGIYRIIEKADADFKKAQELGVHPITEKSDNPTIEYIAKQEGLFDYPRLINVPNIRLEINTDKKIVIPTKSHFGRSFGHILLKFYFFGTHQEFLDRLKGEGYKLDF